MAKNLELQFQLKANDRASRTFKTTANQAKRSMQEVENASQKAVRTSEKAAKARQALNIRSERDIQREIKRTEIQYERLKRSGMATSRELARAHEQVRNRVRELNAEMGRTPTGQRLGNIARGVMGVGAGVGVGMALAKQPIQTTADYNLQLAYLANTAYSGQSKKDKKAGMDKIHNVIKESITRYGGSKETALEALNSVVAQGKVSVDDALELLPTIQKNAIATGASTTDIAGLVNAGLGYGIKKEDIQDFIDYANSAGKSGGFEIKDMAQYAPSLFAAASGAGLKGMEGAKEMFKMLQQIYNVSGGSAETATNTMGFLSKLNSQDTQNRASKIKYFDRKGKQREINLKDSIGSYMAQGKDTVGAFLSVVDDILAGDKGYQKVLKELENAKADTAKSEALNRVADYMMGSRVGELVADRQAWLGLYGIRSQKQTRQNVEEGYKKAIGSTNEDAEFIGEQAAISFQRAGNTEEMAKIEAFSSITNWSGEMAGKLADYGAQYPELTKALMGASEGVKILGGAAIAAAGSIALFGGFDLGRIFNRSGSAAAGAAGFGSRAFSIKNLAKAGGIAGLATLLTSSEDITNTQIHELGLKIQKGRATEVDKAEHQRLIKEAREQAKVRDAVGLIEGGTIRSFFASEKEKASAMSFIEDYFKSETRPEYLSQIANLKSIREQQKLAYAQNIANGLSGVFASDEEKQAARALLQQKAAEQESVDLTPLEYKIDGVSTNFSQDIQALGHSLSQNLTAVLEAQTKVIQNHITVELDGSVVARHTTDYIYREFARGQV